MSAPSSIAGAAFLRDTAFVQVMAALEQAGDRARVVGGAVRNTLLGEAVDDVDIATTARPATVIARVRAAGLKAVPTGVDHGTVTVVAAGRPFEVTTLRADVATDGRHAVVAYGRDWAEDAQRRDFTMNAVYADADGRLLDPVGGVADALLRRVRFIGDPRRRIEEDYLRILRFFRFQACYGRGAPDSPGLAAAAALKDGLDQLSRERIGAEMRKLVGAAGAGAALGVMQDAGIVDHILLGGADLSRWREVQRLAGHFGAAVDLELHLAALAKDRDGLAAGLRLSGREAKRVAAIVGWSRVFSSRMDAERARTAVVGAGNAVALSALLLAAADSGQLPDDDVQQLAATFAPPPSPVTAARLMAEGFQPGPALGVELRRRQAAWIAAGCPPTWPIE